VSTFLQLTVSGLSAGFLYALIALGFVVILKSTRVMNLFQAGFVLLAGYLAYQFHVAWHIPFVFTVFLCMAAMGLLGVVIEWSIISRMRGGFDSAVLVTAGLLTVLSPVVSAIWSDDTRQIDDPWGLRTVKVGGVVISEANLWVVGLSLAALAVFFAVFQLSSVGIAGVCSVVSPG
jgi:branched-chain amino acid transport system permease protein